MGDERVSQTPFGIDRLWKAQSVGSGCGPRACERSAWL